MQFVQYSKKQKTPKLAATTLPDPVYRIDLPHTQSIDTVLGKATIQLTMAKRIAIDQLAQMVAQGFSDLRTEMQNGFAHLGNEIEDVRTQLQEHGLRLDRIERKLDNIVERVDNCSVRLERLEKWTKSELLG